MTLREALEQILESRSLTKEQAAAALRDIVEGAVPDSVISAFLIALRMKGETAEEIAGFATTMRDSAAPVRPKATGLVDTCGTGGDGAGTANISTTAAFIVAGAGLPVAKHGNRALSSKAGSADVLEALGVRLDLSPEQVEHCIDEAGIGFMFAAAFHPAMAKVMPVRRALATRTVFNILGPLTNPARPSYQLIGVARPEFVELIAYAIASMGIDRAVVVHSAGGVDELTLSGTGMVFVVDGGNVHGDAFLPADAGLPECDLDAIKGGDAQANAASLRAVLEGKPSEIADCAVLNAGAAFMAARRAETIRDGVELAQEVIASGAALDSLERLVALCKSL